MMESSNTRYNDELMTLTRRLQSLYLPETVRQPTTTTATTTTVISSSTIVSPFQSTPLKKALVRLVPYIDFTNQCFIFDIVDHELEQGGPALKLGRYSGRELSSDRISFKSKVVSRSHAEIWLSKHDGKVYIKDTGSSMGTFVNHTRLSPTSMESMAPHVLADGDIIQLGVDYTFGHQSTYKAVRICLEIDPQPSTSTFHIDNFKKILTRQNIAQNCCICLYFITPFQALFVAPCSHMYHYQCLRPLLSQHYPGFLCPVCRTYSNLDASVAVEEEKVVQMLEKNKAVSLVLPKKENNQEAPRLSSLLVKRPIASTSLFGVATQHVDTGENANLFQEEAIKDIHIL